MPQYYQKETVMKNQSKKAITITPVRKATEEELAGIKVPQEGETFIQTVVGITHLPEHEGKGRSWFPTHNFDVIKNHREHLFYKYEQPKFLNESRILMLPTTPKDLEDFRKNWLNKELKEIEKLIENPHLSRRSEIELNKYKTAVTDELEGKRRITASANKREPEKKEQTKHAKQIGYQYFAFYQIISENTPSIKALRIPEGRVDEKKDFARDLFQELRGDTIFNGDSFYVEYRRLKRLHDNKMLLNEVNDPRNPEAKRRYKEYTFRIAEYFGNEDYKRWWIGTFTQ
jgi:hypothetical protein